MELSAHVYQNDVKRGYTAGALASVSHAAVTGKIYYASQITAWSDAACTVSLLDDTTVIWSAKLEANKTKRFDLKKEYIGTMSKKMDAVLSAGTGAVSFVAIMK